MSTDTEIIVKAALGAGLVCMFFFCTAVILYFFQVECCPRPRIRRLRRRSVHPLWLLRPNHPKYTRTLSDSEIESMFPARGYENMEQIASVCSVCLEDIGCGQMVRLFECNHCFHIQCIDPWLKTKVSCPTCRKEVVVLT